MKKVRKENVNDWVYGIILGIIITLFFCAMIWYGTSDKVWYANTHDKDCESMLNDTEDCGCYNRFMEKSKNK